MKRTIITWLLLSLMLVSCNASPSRPIEVTREVTREVEVTRIVQQTNTVTPTPRKSATPTPYITATQEPVHELDYFYGIVVITQYYTFLGHGLHEEAYQLLSKTQGEHADEEDYVKMAKICYKAVEIVTIQPFDEYLREQGGPIGTKKVDTKNKFYVQTRSWGENGMSGSVVNGELHDTFITLVQENGELKIATFYIQED